MNNIDICSLDELKIGESGFVCTLPEDIEKRRRLMSLGLIKGTEITAVNESPLGDPKAYFFRGAVIALRHNDAKNIIIKTNGDRWDRLEQ